MAINCAHTPLSTLGEHFSWEKDRHFRYTRCNENYAEAAGLDSPAAIVGKTDEEMPWRHLADFFRAGDQMVLELQGLERHLVQEKEPSAYGELDILVCEKPLLLRDGKVVGVTGHFLNITGRRIIQVVGSYSPATKRFDLGPQFSNQYLTRMEARVLERLLLHWPASRIAEDFCNSVRTIEHHIDVLKRKLQCRTIGDLVQLVVSAGIHLTVFEVAPVLHARPEKRRMPTPSIS
jgi:DNA-binding CsgD family transcriptional regulator